MAQGAVEAKGVNIRQAFANFSVTPTCYRYQSKLSEENEMVADWLMRLTHNQQQNAYAERYNRTVRDDWQ